MIFWSLPEKTKNKFFSYRSGSFRSGLSEKKNRRKIFLFSPSLRAHSQTKKVLSQVNIHWHVSEILKKKKLPGNHNQLYQHRLI